MKIEIRKTPDKGEGLFATEQINPGEQILEFIGNIVTYDEYLLNPPAVHAGNPLQIGLKEYIDLQPTDFGVFTNHSCSPNAGVKNDRFLVAIRTILPNEEVTFDYSTTMNDGSWILEKCNCGSPECRTIVQDFVYLPKELQKKYCDMGIVQSYLRAIVKF
jgi:uncharacterized protein